MSTSNNSNSTSKSSDATNITATSAAPNPTKSGTSRRPTAATTSYWSASDHLAVNGYGSGFVFLPDFVEHPKRPDHHKHADGTSATPTTGAQDENEQQQQQQVSFYHDFVAGGMAGSASVVVGHPFDTIKVRMQTSNAAKSSIRALLAEFGGPASLFRGMGAPLSAAAVINAIVFSSYGAGSRVYDEYVVGNNNNSDMATDSDMDSPLLLTHDPWQKAFACGAFAGLVQCTVICPMEHVKCRLQVQHTKGSPDFQFKGPIQATRTIVTQHGLPRLYQGWWSTVWREVPAFGLYFAVYDYLKDQATAYFAKQAGVTQEEAPEAHTWLASAFAGGCAGSITWAIVYPTDVIKTRIQTAPLNTPRTDLSMYRVGRDIVATHGWRHLFRGLSITLIRAFPVNGTIFPVYEFTLKQITSWESKDCY